MTDTTRASFAIVALITIFMGIVLISVSVTDLAHTVSQHQEDYGLGAVVTTTSGYECLTNDSFTGVVIRGDCVCDQTLTIRNRDGIERQIAIEFLEPVE